MRTLTALYDSYDDAEATIRDLEAAGVRHENISIVANNATRTSTITKTSETSEAGPGASAGATIGAVLGGGAGLLAGLGMLAIPGVGPVVAAGWLVATAVGVVGGAAVGGAGGGIIGAMISAGVPEQDAHVYAEGVRRGGNLVTIRVEDSQVTMAENILRKNRMVDITRRGAEYRETGWNNFDENAPVYNETQLENERRLRSSNLV